MGLARRDSPFRGGRYLGLAQALTSELPATLAALRAGDTSEWRATLVARETACLDPADRRVADAELGPVLAGLGDREVEAAARAVAYRLDPRAFVDRTRGAATDRTVTLRPAPDTMSRLGGFLPVAQGVADLHGAVRGRPTGAGPTVTRVPAGRSWPTPWSSGSPDRHTAGAVPVEVQLVLPEETLLAGGDEPGDLAGAGPVPAGAARALVTDPDATVWLRRVYARPADGSLVAMDSKRRRFPTGLRRLLQVRDRTCRTPWCGAPIRHTDHVIPVAAGRHHVRRERARAVRGLQLHQTSPRLDRHTRTRTRPGPVTGSRSPPPPDTPTPATHHPSHTPDHPTTTEASSRNTSAASSTPPEQGVPTGVRSPAGVRSRRAARRPGRAGPGRR